MTVFAVLLLLVPMVDQAIKLFVRAHVGGRSLSLGVLGQLRPVESQIWMVRALPGVKLQAMWTVWLAAAGSATSISILLPVLGWSLGLLLGGALSHALECSLRGSICDYVCLRFWPAFNLADVALTAGALGLGIELAALVL